MKYVKDPCNKCKLPKELQIKVAQISRMQKENDPSTWTFGFHLRLINVNIPN